MCFFVERVSAQDGTRSPATAQSPLAPITVPPYSTQDISLAAAMSQFPAALPFGSVRIQYSGPPGSLQAEVTSVESNGNLVIDSHIQNEGNGWAGSGANPWHLDDDTESVLFLTNESNQPAHIGFQVRANGSAPYYLTKLLLNPHETRAIDLRKLRDAQQPDFKNNLIPASATDGSVTWVRNDNLPVMGRLMQIHRKAGMASNYDCCVCVCPYNYTPSINEMAPILLYLYVTSEGGMAFEAGYEDCNSFEYWYDYTTSASWSSSNSNIASIQGLGTVKGVSVGTASISASYSGYKYTFNGSHCNATPVPGGASGPANVVPHIDSISPTYALVGSSNVQITINGTEFTSNATVNLPSGFTASSGCTPGNSVSSTKIVTCVNISVNRAIQAVSFSVTNNPGNSNSVAFTADGPVTLAVVSDNWSSNTRQITYSVATLAGDFGILNWPSSAV